MSKIKMQDTRKCRRSKKASPRTTFGVRFSRGNVFPGYAKNAYPGLMYLHASGVAGPKGCREPGVRVYGRNRTPEGVHGLFWTALVYDRRYS